ncbi:MAG: hypothetical protein V4587_09575 [Acidobacteriota bacterium]
MFDLMNFPVLLAVLSLLGMWFVGRVGRSIREKHISRHGEPSSDFNLALTATLTLLGLIIGFSFSMAMSRYDQRKNYEEAEANAIGTEYVRVDVLPAADAAKIRNLLVKYTDLRVAYYQSRDRKELQGINANTAQLQDQLWKTVVVPASAQPTPVSALTLAGMNDVLNSQGYTQAAWWYRIPTEAWVLMIAIAMYSNLLMGFGAPGSRTDSLLLVLPFLVGISFLLVADIDSPRGGLVRVHPTNLISLSTSLHGH